MRLLELAPKLIFMQVILGSVAYGVADANPAFVLLGLALGVLAWYLVEAPGGRPLPRAWINLAVVAVLLWLLHRHFVMDQPMLLALGQFILFTQLFKLYDRKANRDWGQLIVMSLMLVFCASIISADVLFGVLLAVYLIVALFAVLVFQLKLARDRVEAVTQQQTPSFAQPAAVGAPATARYRRHFNALVMSAGAAAIVLSAVFFVLIPRGHGAGLLGEARSPSQRSVSGYDDEVNLSGGQMSTSRIPVMNVALRQGDRHIGSAGQAFLLRGAALDTYDAEARRWIRGRSVHRRDRGVEVSNDGPVELLRTGDDQEPLTQSVTLRARTTDTLFAAFAPRKIEIDQPVRFSPIDQILAPLDRGSGVVQYVVHSAERHGGPVRANLRRLPRSRELDRLRGAPEFDWTEYARSPVGTGPRVAELTQRLIAEHEMTRDPEQETSPDDWRIADMLSRHLQTQYAYSLNLPPMDEHTDPIETFLFEYQRGHCEFFASALCAMLRSVGIRSRVVTGFRATEYNAVGGYYVVRARNAHAWVEVWVDGEGWRTVDPSPQAELADHHQSDAGLWAAVRDLYDYLEFQWINRVISYDATQQRTVMTQLNRGVDGVTGTFEQLMEGVGGYMERFHRLVIGPANYLLLGMLCMLVGAAGFMLAGNVSRHRRFIRRLRLDAVGRRRQRQLARQLDFYFDATELVEQAGHYRPDWRTPGSFARQLARQDGRFEAFVRLTDLFYEIRFGGRDLDEARRAEVERQLDELRQSLDDDNRLAA